MNLKDIKEFNKVLIFSLLIFIVMVISFGKNVDFYYSEGVAAFNAGNYQKAEKYLKMALLLQPSIENTSNIKYMIGISALYDGDLVTARAYLPSKDFSHISNSGTNQISRRNFLKEIAQWESLSNSPIKKIKKESLPLWVGWMLFFSIFSIIMLAFFLYTRQKLRKSLRISHAALDDVVESSEDQEIFVSSMPTNVVGTPPSDMPSEEEIKNRLESLLAKEQDTQNEKKTVIEKPEEVIQNVNDEASDDELIDLTKAIQEILSKESENSRT